MSKCDRCGDFAAFFELIHNEFISSIKISRWNLCKKCEKDFKEWIKNDKNEQKTIRPCLE